MPTIRQITLPDGVTYDLAATAMNREVVPIVTEYSGSETTFNALEVTEDSLQRPIYNINAPNGTPLFTWVSDLTIGYPVYFNQPSIMYGGAEFSNGGLWFKNGTALPVQTAAASYNVLCIDSFASGGRTKFCTATSSATANTIVTRQANGYIYAVYYNSSNGSENIASYTSSVAFVDSNGWHRKTSKAQFGAWISDTLSKRIVVEAKAIFTGLSLAANNIWEKTYSVAKSGYTPIGVVGYDFHGSGSSRICVYQMQISGNNLVVWIRADGSAVSNGSLNARIMYMLN